MSNKPPPLGQEHSTPFSYTERTPPPPRRKTLGSGMPPLNLRSLSQKLNKIEDSEITHDFVQLRIKDADPSHGGKENTNKNLLKRSSKEIDNLESSIYHLVSPRGKLGGSLQFHIIGNEIALSNLNRSIKHIIFSEKYHRDFRQRLYLQIIEIDSPKLIVKLLLNHRDNIKKEKDREKFLEILNALFRDHLTIPILYGYFSPILYDCYPEKNSLDDLRALLETPFFKENSLQCIDTLLRYEAPLLDKANLLRGHSYSKLFALAFLEKRMLKLNKKVFSSQIPENIQELSFDIAHQFMNTLYYSKGSKEIRKLPEEVIDLLTTVRRVFTEHYGPEIALKQVSELLIFSNIIQHLRVKHSLHKNPVAKLKVIFNELTNQFSGAITERAFEEENDLSLNALFPEFAKTHREFIEKNSTIF